MRWIVVGLCMAALAGCSGAPQDRIEGAAAVAARAGMSGGQIRTSTFLLQTWHRLPRQAAPRLTVYIEGDGYAWASRGRLSADPTPKAALALTLAAADRTSDAIAYLGRPCQYVNVDRLQDRRCADESYWAGKRFAEEVISATDQAIAQLKAKAGATEVILVGYSGGGAVAALVAARRSDVAGLITVAGNLDHAAQTRHHNVSPMTGSLNPVDIAARLAAVPQIHFSGGRDEVVPPFIAESFARAMGSRRCATLSVVPGASHEGGWSERWSGLFSRPPSCRESERFQ